MIGDLEHHARFAPDEPLEEFLARIPAAWTVCLLADEGDRAIQLLCVKNLRASLKRRLGPDREGEGGGGASRRIDLRSVVRRVSWTRVDSAFEQDLVYLEIARRAFPQSYAGVLGFRPAWWIHVDPSADRPRFVRTSDPGLAGRSFGPLSDRSVAEKLVHAVEDLFDLCRDPAALAAAPAGPCQWKQMKRCVGPCDGTVSLAAYRALVDHAADVLADLPRALEGHELRMRQAAAALQFEAAGRMKVFSEKLSDLGQGAFRYLRPIEQCRFVAVMPGRVRESGKLFAITPGRIDPLLCLCRRPSGEARDDLLRIALAALATPGEPIQTPAPRERLSLATHHLFPSRRSPGIFIPMNELDADSLTAAFVEVNRKRAALQDDEGEVRGLQAL